MKTLKRLLEELNACVSARDWVGGRTIEQAVADCPKGELLLWIASIIDIGLQPLTLAKGHCANTVRHLMKDERSIKAVDTAIAFGQGRATMEELSAAATSAYDAYAAADNAADAYAAAAAADDDAAYAADDAADAYAFYAADADAAIAENQMQTADICRKYIGQLIINKVNELLK